MKKSEIKQMIQEELAKVMQEKAPQMKVNPGETKLYTIMGDLDNVPNISGIEKGHREYKNIGIKVIKARKALWDVLYAIRKI